MISIFVVAIKVTINFFVNHKPRNPGTQRENVQEERPLATRPPQFGGIGH